MKVRLLSTFCLIACLLAEASVLAQQSVPQLYDPTLTEHMSERDKRTLAKMQEGLNKSFESYASTSPRTFLNDAGYIFEKDQEKLGPEAKKLVHKFQREWGIPTYSPTGDRFNSADMVRIDHFSKRWAAENQRPPASAERRIEGLQDYEIFFVPGFMNELAPGESYFADARAALREMNIPDSQVHLFPTNSLKSVSENSDALAAAYRKAISRSGAKSKVLLVGHSMGGNTVLAMLAKHPDVLHDSKLAAAVTVQSPLKGTPSASFAKKSAEWIKSKCSGVLSECVLGVSDQFDSGADSLQSSSTKDFADKFYKNAKPEDLARLNQVLFYVSSSADRSVAQLAPFLTDDQTDGTVPTANQHIRLFGRQLAYLPDVAHSDLFLTGKLSNLTVDQRKSFIRTLFSTLLDPTTNEEFVMQVAKKRAPERPADHAASKTHGK